MKCPLLVMTATRVERSQGIAYIDCLKEECRWWSTEMNQCDPTGLLPWVSKLEGILADIKDKMCDEGRFRK